MEAKNLKEATVNVMSAISQMKLCSTLLVTFNQSSLMLCFDGSLIEQLTCPSMSLKIGKLPPNAHVGKRMRTTRGVANYLKRLAVHTNPSGLV